MRCPSFRSTVVRRVNTSFTAFSSISCIMADIFWRRASFCAASDADWSRYIFDFKNLHSKKSEGIRSGDLGVHVWLKYWMNMQFSHNVECSRSFTSRTVWGAAASCIKMTVWRACRAYSSAIILFYNSAAYRWPVKEFVSKPVFVTSSEKKNGQIMKSPAKPYQTVTLCCCKSTSKMDLEFLRSFTWQLWVSTTPEKMKWASSVRLWSHSCCSSILLNTKSRSQADSVLGSVVTCRDTFSGVIRFALQTHPYDTLVCLKSSRTLHSPRAETADMNCTVCSTVVATAANAEGHPLLGHDVKVPVVSNFLSFCSMQKKLSVICNLPYPSWSDMLGMTQWLFPNSYNTV